MTILGENENPIIWKINILKSLIDLSDIDFQKETWLGNNPNFISSYIETVNTLFDDFDFERYVKYYASINGKNDLYFRFNDLINMINQYEEPDNDELILKDPKWISITNKAKEIIAEWNKSNA